ncbi:DUF6160 family protein [Marinobacter koreensis]|uniref:DUF6160 family protein n=1 Tax=Marinobacter koreensis TaxID=335974 RepID=A0ABW0RH06_9GAMM|nr:DUF6160 family protein [Marinobacter koreensis]MCK7548557.1 DUF6160 family protein [Marinobacter koreensis]
MKGLKKLTLATAIAAAPFAANAELKAMNDIAMGDVTGQSGVTIELSTKVDIGEVAYQDDGFLAISGLSIGGAYDPATGAQGNLDDVKLMIDVAGTGGVADTGAGAVGNAYLEGAAIAKPNVSWTNTQTTSTDPATTPAAAANEAGMPQIEDGDLVIGIRSVSGAPVDFGVGIDSVKLAKSTESANLGNLGAGTGTTLISNFKMSGMLGPIDVVIQENQNAMNVNAYFNAQGTLNADFVGTYIDFKLHNSRGTDTNGLTIVDANNNTLVDTSFAHAQVDIGKATNAAGNDALAFNVNDFSGDLDLTNIRMGSANAASIGDVYLTDMKINAQMTVYGH